MANGRKAFHFDLDEEKLKDLYPSDSKTGYKGAWAKIQAFMEEHGFEHVQYSGYESVRGISYLKAFRIIEALQRTYPWFMDCAKVATVTNISEHHDVLARLRQKTERHEKVPELEQEPPKEYTQDSSEPQERVTLNSEVCAARSAAKALDEQGGQAEPPREEDVR